jgi:hypothetical protein
MECLSSQANYTYRATAACQRSQYQHLVVEGVAWSAQRTHKTVNLGFIDGSSYFFIQVTPQLSLRGWVHPVTNTPLFRKSNGVGNRTRNIRKSNQALQVKWSLVYIPLEACVRLFGRCCLLQVTAYRRSGLAPCPMGSVVLPIRCLMQKEAWMWRG